MNTQRNRREFLADVGRGMLVATVGYEIAGQLGLAAEAPETAAKALTFGSLEPLVCLMQDTPVNRLIPELVKQMESGADLRRLTAAAALANARTFGGEDYVGFHTMMALAPAFHMSQELTPELQPLPVFKVLFRNTNRIQEHGGRPSEVLKLVESSAASGISPEQLRTQIRSKDVASAERTLGSLTRNSVDEAFNDLLIAVQDQTEVHRVVLPYRAWDLLGLIGQEQAETLLRQSVRYCVKAESWPHGPHTDEPRSLLPKVMEEHKLLGRSAGDRRADDLRVDEMSQTIFRTTPLEAAAAAANALSEGLSPASVGEAISLAANQLVLRDHGRLANAELAGKPIGSVHGDSIGVHACDSANAWRNLARVSNARNSFASLILGAYQVALDRAARGGDFLNWEPLPLAVHVNQIHTTDAPGLLREIDEAIKGNLQAHAAALVQRYGELGFEPRPLFDLLLRYAVSEDGALHAEKYYRTVCEEFAATRPAFRWRQLVALARVTASEFGRPAPGLAEARALLKV